MNQYEQYLFIDFEFTMPDSHLRIKGFKPEIIEAGIVCVENDRIINQFSSFVKPMLFPELTDRCKSFLKISQSQVDNGISFKELINKLKYFAENKSTKVVTWGNMDMRVLKNNCEQAQIEFPFKESEIDLSMEYKRFFGDQNQTGLWKAVKEYGKEGTGKHHRALDDALTTFNIFRLVEKDKKYMEKLEPTTIGDRVDFSKLFNHLAL